MIEKIEFLVLIIKEMTEVAKRTSQGLPVFPAEILDDILIFTDDLRLIIQLNEYISDKDLTRILDRYYKNSETVYNIDQLEVLELMFKLNYEVPWDNPNFHYKLTEGFMLHYEFIFNLYSNAVWREICRFQNLTEKAMRHFIDKVDWFGCHEKCHGLIRHNYYGIYQSQDLSPEFITEFENKLSFIPTKDGKRLTTFELRKESRCHCSLLCCNEMVETDLYKTTCWYDFNIDRYWLKTGTNEIFMAAQLDAVNL